MRHGRVSFVPVLGETRWTVRGRSASLGAGRRVGGPEPSRQAASRL